MRARMIQVGVGVMLASVSSMAIAQATLGRINVRAHRIGGWSPTVICTGEACGQVIDDLTSGMGTHMLGDQENPIGAESDDAFCSRLSAKQPAGCSTSGDIPSVPDYDPNWQGNGCGSAGGGWLESMVAGYLLDDYPQYTGNIDAPLPGISFLEACNAHDRCWGLANDRGTCDNQFGDALAGICGSNSTCNGIAGGYRFGVGSDTGTDAYNASVAQYQCAAWRHDMQQNNCPQ
jgi:hypothetical protein